MRRSWRRIPINRSQTSSAHARVAASCSNTPAPWCGRTVMAYLSLSVINAPGRRCRRALATGPQLHELSALEILQGRKSHPEGVRSGHDRDYQRIGRRQCCPRRTADCRDRLRQPGPILGPEPPRLRERRCRLRTGRSEQGCGRSRRVRYLRPRECQRGRCALPTCPGRHHPLPSSEAWSRRPRDRGQRIHPRL